MTRDPDLTQSAFQLECAGAGREEHARTLFSEPTDWVSSYVRKCHRWLHAALEMEGRAPCPKFTSGSPNAELQLQNKSHQTPPPSLQRLQRVPLCLFSNPQGLFVS